MYNIMSWGSKGSSRIPPLILALVIVVLTTIRLVDFPKLARETSIVQNGCSQIETSNDDKCFLELDVGRWELAIEGCPKPHPGILSPCDHSRTIYPRQWVWADDGTAAACIPRELRYQEVFQLFRNKRIALVGDSHLRKMYGYLSTFLEDPKISVPPQTDEKKHVDYKYLEKKSNTSIEFYWRANIITTVHKLKEWNDGVDLPPDLIVMDASAHQAKWARNYTEFVGEVPLLVDQLSLFHEQFGPTRPLFWIISPPFREPYIPEFENTTHIYGLKKFNRVLRDAGYMRPDGPVFKIDLFKIAQECMDWCYRDGTHVVETVNTLLWQIVTGVYRKVNSE